MSEPKTKPTGDDVLAYLDSIEPERKRNEGKQLLAMFKEITGSEAEMWGPSIIGFGRYIMTYANGKEQEWMLTGFSPRKQRHVLYIMSGFEGEKERLDELGKHKIGKSCLYINKLADVDLNVLRTMIQESVEHMKATNRLPE